MECPTTGICRGGVPPERFPAPPALRVLRRKWVLRAVPTLMKWVRWFRQRGSVEEMQQRDHGTVASAAVRARVMRAIRWVPVCDLGN